MMQIDMVGGHDMEPQVISLRNQIAAMAAQLADLKIQLAHAEERMRISQTNTGDVIVEPQGRWPLRREEYQRYGRAMIMREVGIEGQVRLRDAKVLVVGVGGLGCPAAAYLVGAGVGTLGLVDGDHVELSNLHRQIAHSTDTLGMSKVESAERYLKALNPLVKLKKYASHLSPESAIPIFEQYDLVLDCTDHPTSRYLISDVCVLTGKPLISASALRTEGQLIVLNNPPRPPGDSVGGPCYRCIFPKPPPPESVLSCGEGGILGPVVGVMGVLQALEAIKLLMIAKKAPDFIHSSIPARATMLIFSAYGNSQFRSIRMRSRHAACSACSASSSITKESLKSGSLDYVAFCGVTLAVDVLPPEQRISASEFARASPNDTRTIIDVRDETQFAMCALEGAINVPWTGNRETWLERLQDANVSAGTTDEQYVVCRYGNDSQLAAKAMLEQPGASKSVYDIRGGFKAWREEVDHDWPLY